MHVLEIIHSSPKSHFLSDSHCVVTENIHTPHGGQRKYRGDWEGGGGGSKRRQFLREWGLSYRGFDHGGLSKIGELFSN